MSNTKSKTNIRYLNGQIEILKFSIKKNIDNQNTPYIDKINILSDIFFIFLNHFSLFIDQINQIITNTYSKLNNMDDKLNNMDNKLINMEKLYTEVMRERQKREENPEWRNMYAGSSKKHKSRKRKI